jgi:hypothetical protein
MTTPVYSEFGAPSQVFEAERCSDCNMYIATRVYI